MLENNFDSATNHLNSLPMFLNCLLSDLTVIYLMSTVHMDKIWVEIAKKFEMRTSGGGGGGVTVISDTPGRGGEGGSKKDKFLRTSFMDDPLIPN